MKKMLMVMSMILVWASVAITQAAQFQCEFLWDPVLTNDDGTDLQVTGYRFYEWAEGTKAVKGEFSYEIPVSQFEDALNPNFLVVCDTEKRYAVTAYVTTTTAFREGPFSNTAKPLQLFSNPRRFRGHTIAPVQP